jgi:V8-like Glu-specific endopeptidase
MARCTTHRGAIHAPFGATALAAALCTGCGDPGGREPAPGRLGIVDAPIINGQIEPGYDAVVFVYGNMSGCSGTIVHANPAAGIGHVLTAAHCVNQPPQFVVQADDYNSIGAKQFGVLDYKKHPSYNGQLYDFAMIRIGSVDANTPSIPPLSPAEDKLAPGTQVLHVGYGLTSYPSGQTTKRHSILGKLDTVTSIALTYLQPNGGPCQGDSGGPNLVLGTVRVAGVISAGDEGCDQSGISGRASAVYDGFIKPYIDNAPIVPPKLTCEQCHQLSTTGSGQCSDEVQACLGDAVCKALVDCLDACPPQSSVCQMSCISQHGAGLSKYEAIFSCVCDVACTGECKDAAFCNQPSTGASTTGAGPGPTSTASGAQAGAGGGGGAGAGTTSGADGSGAGANTGWVAGDEKDRHPEGNLLSSGCAVGRGDKRHAAVVLLALAALAVLGRSGRSGRGGRGGRGGRRRPRA